MSKSFGWGIVGTGTIARQFASDLAHLPDARLAAICSRSQDTAEAFRQTFKAGRAFCDVEALCRDAEIDALYVATPNTAHLGPALRAIACGKPVLIEKPIAVSAGDARRLAEAASEKSFVMEGMWTRFLPAVRRARALIDEGAIGKIKTIRAELSYFHEEDVASRFFRPDLGGGAALDLGVYPVSLALHFLGRPSHVSGARRMARSGVDMRTEIRLEFDGAVAELACGFDRDGDNEFVIEGSKGALRLGAPFLKAQRLLQFTPGAFAASQTMRGGQAGSTLARIVDRMPMPGRKISRFAFPGGGLQFQAAAVMEAVRQGSRQTTVMPLADSIAALEIIEKVLADGSNLA